MMGSSGSANATSADLVRGNHNSSSPFRVLGIALVIDQLGREPKLAFRYPTSLDSGTSPSEKNATGTYSSSAVPGVHSSSPHTSSGSSSEELFFTLPSRQMAKLFRPKHSLCGQPMTLSVGGVVFCFRAVLMGELESSNNNNTADNSSLGAASLTTQSTNNNNNSNTDQLVLFSVIVALAPQVDIASIPISGGYEGNNEDTPASHNPSLHRRFSSPSRSDSEVGSQAGSHMVEGEAHQASSFLAAIRRVQVSLARLCRVLEREERRCRYISMQSNHFFKIRADLSKKWEHEKVTVVAAGTSSKLPPAAGNSPKADFSSKGPPTDRKKHHRRGNSFSQALLTGAVVGSDVTKERILLKKDSNQSLDNQQDREQEVLEHILASAPHHQPLDEDMDNKYRCGSNTADRHHGNLARELVQVFHALSRNDHNFPPSPAVLSGRDSVVYINRHIAVAIEAVSLPKTFLPESLGNAILRPYHTLIFPNLTPSELLQALQSSGFTAPLQQLLLMVRPSKPLTDIAVDANLPLSVTMELANYLVSHGACVASAVLTRSSRLACKRVDRIQELALDFSQTFDNWTVNLFVVVSFLTRDGWTLGESMMALKTEDDPVAASLRSAILVSIFQEGDTDDYVYVEDNDDSVAVNSSDFGSGPSDHDVQPQQKLRHHPRSEELEEILYSMAIWLCSHQVLGHLHDYLVLPRNNNTPSAGATQGGRPGAPSGLPGTDAVEGKEEDSKSNPDAVPGYDELSGLDDTLLRELQECDCLNGNVSTVAIAWRFGLDEEKLKSWAIRHDKLRLVSRLPAVGDDCGAV